MMDLIREWCRLACGRDVVMRGLLYAAVVGPVLITINHGAAIWRGEVGPSRIVEIVLTLLVPFFVSVLSSVGAVRQVERASATTSPL